VDLPVYDPHARTATAKPSRQTAASRKAEHRDARGWHTAAKRNKFGAPTKAKEQADADRLARTVKAETRRRVWTRSAVCEGCGDTERQSAKKWPKAAHECHEVIPRSLTRGQAPAIRFSSENSARLCCQCHRLIQQHRGAFEFLSDIRMDGQYAVRWKRPDGTFQIVPNPRDRQS